MINQLNVCVLHANRDTGAKLCMLRVHWVEQENTVWKHTDFY